MADPDAADLVEAPIAEPIEVRPGVTATRIPRYRRGQDADSVSLMMLVIWREHEYADLTLMCASPDIERALLVRDDIVEVARSTRLVPLDEHDVYAGVKRRRAQAQMSHRPIC
jgi:hypothetical protein